MKTKTLFISTLLIFAIGSGWAEDRTVPNRPVKKSLEERLRYHGFDDTDALKRFMAQLNKAARSKDQKALVGLVQFPFSTYNRGVLVKTYENQNELLEQFDAVFSERVIESLLKSKLESLFVRDQGAMIGNGEVWLFPFEDGIRIKAINPISQAEQDAAVKDQP